MNPRLYLETTIPSVLTARRGTLPETIAMQDSPRRWWNARLNDFCVFISAEVIREAARGDTEMAAARLETIQPFAILPITDDVLLLRDGIMRLGFIPPKAAADAVHLAVAACHAMDFLLTWNCSHINNGEHEKAHQRVCWAYGHELPVIVTPNELMPPEP